MVSMFCIFFVVWISKITCMLQDSNPCLSVLKQEPMSHQKVKIKKRVWFDYVRVVTTPSQFSNAIPLRNNAAAFSCSLSGLTHCASSLSDQDGTRYQVPPLVDTVLSADVASTKWPKSQSSTLQAGPHSSLRSDYRHALTRPTSEQIRNLLFNLKTAKDKGDTEWP